MGASRSHRDAWKILPKSLPEASRDLPELTKTNLGLFVTLLRVVWDFLGLILDLLGRSWGSPDAPGTLSGASGEPLGASEMDPGGPPGGLRRKSLIFEALWVPF